MLNILLMVSSEIDLISTAFQYTMIILRNQHAVYYNIAQQADTVVLSVLSAIRIHYSIFIPTPNKLVTNNALIWILTLILFP